MTGGHPAAAADGGGAAFAACFTAPVSSVKGLHPHIVGILLMMLALTVVNTSDAIAKWTIEDLPVFQVMFFQACGLMILASVVAREPNPVRLVRTDDPWLQTARSACQFVMGYSFYNGLKVLQFADLIAILFIGPLVITAMAHVFLRERAGPHRWAACVVGFIGGLIIVRPGSGMMGWGAVWPMFSIMSWSTYVVLTRKVSLRNSTGNMMLWASLISLAVLAALSPWYWQTPVDWQWAGLVVIALLSSSSNGLTIRAYTLAPASLLAPIIYAEIIGATIYGWIFWREFPDAWTWLGASVIVLAGLYVVHRESLATRRR